MTLPKRRVAYFSMEIALENALPTYSGGLGVLAGDTIRAAADLRFRMVAVSLLYRSGYFTQRISADGSQIAEPVEWRVEDFLHEETPRVHVPLEDRRVELRCWRYDVKGVNGFEVPVYFLDADLPSNEECDRSLTGTLYGGDAYYRLRQEVVLGIGGLRMLRALGHTDLLRYHMNEGHAALLTLELLAAEAERKGRSSIRADDIEHVRSRCIFTTHTPVPAGHDKFPLEYMLRVFPQQTSFFDLKDTATAQLVSRVLESSTVYSDLNEAARSGALVNMTYLALSLSHFVNGVAKLHGETSRKMFPGVGIDTITNGVHAATWTCPAFQQLYDGALPDWRQDNFSLREALRIPREKIWSAHMVANSSFWRKSRRRPDSSSIRRYLRSVSRGASPDTSAPISYFPISTGCDKLRRKPNHFKLFTRGKRTRGTLPELDIIRQIFKAKKALRKAVTVVFWTTTI